MEMIKKLLNVDIKEIGERSLQFVGSTETADRDGEVILASGWDLKNYRKNPVFMWAHKYDQPPIGRATKVRAKDGQLLFDIEFAPRETYEFADTIYKLYKGGFLHATSVGFVPIDFVDGDGEKTARRTYKKQELLELSGCPIPSNPDALRLACDSGVVTLKQLRDVGFKIAVPKDALIETKPEVTDNYVRIPVSGEVGKHSDHKIRTIEISAKEGISGLYCVDDKVVITYLFGKSKWDMERARAWVDSHKTVFFDEDGKLSIHHSASGLETKIEPKSISQNAIRDEIDYLNELVEEQIDDKTKTMLLELAHKIDSLCITKQEALPQPVVRVESAPQQIETLDYDELVALARRMGEDIANKTKG